MPSGCDWLSRNCQRTVVQVQSQLFKCFERFERDRMCWQSEDWRASGELLEIDAASPFRGIEEILQEKDVCSSFCFFRMNIGDALGKREQILASLKKHDSRLGDKILVCDCD